MSTDAIIRFSFNIGDYGADRTGTVDATAAIQAAIDAAKAAVTQPDVGAFDEATEVFFPPGYYRVNSIDCTNAAYLMLRAHPASVWVFGSQQVTSGKPIFDFTGSNSCGARGIIVVGQVPGGADPTIIPSVGFLLAITSAGAGGNKMRLDDCGSVGKFNSAPLALVGATDCAFYSCAFQQVVTNRPCLIISSQPDYSISSSFQTITTNSVCNDHTFVGCELHGHNGASASVETIYTRELGNVRFIGGLCDNSGPYHILLQGSTKKNLSLIGVHFYSESGHAADDILNVDGGTLTGLIFQACNTTDNAFSDKIFEGTGTIKAGFVRGIRQAALTGALLYQMAEPGYRFSNNGMAVAGGATRFIGVGTDDAAEANTSFMAERDGVLVGLQARSGGSPSAGQTYTYTLRLNEADTALVATISGTNTTGEDIVNRVDVTRGQRIAIKVILSATATTLVSTAISVGFIPA